MKKIYLSPLFKGIEPSEIEVIIKNKYHTKHYKSGDIIALQRDEYRSLLIIDDGIVRGEMTNFAGDRVIIEDIVAPRAIAPAILYATDNTLPVDVIAVTDVDIVSIHIDNFTRILQSDARVLSNFMRSISDRSKFLSDRVRMLRFGTIKSKLAEYLLEQIKQKSSSEFDIKHTHQELADMFGVTRPALSRAIGLLAEESILTSRKNHFIIIDKNKLIKAAKTV